MAYLFGVFVVISILFSENYGQFLPEIPCPQYFSYRKLGSETIGFLEFPPPRLGQTVKLDVKLSLVGQIPPGRMAGSLQLLEGQEQTLQRIIQGRTVQYVIKFPLPSPIPKLVLILYNGQPVCKGLPDQVQGTPVTTLMLEHMLFTTDRGGQPLASIPNQSGGNFNNVVIGQGQPQFSQPVQQFQQYTPEQYQPQQQQQQSRPIQPVEAPARLPFSEKADGTSQTTKEVCGKVHPEFAATPLIIGGQAIQRGAWPWLAGIYKNSGVGVEFTCGGSLISNSVVLSAAHCFVLSRQTAEDTIVWLGRHNMKNWNEEGSTNIACRQVHTHPDFMKYSKSSYDADIAILILERPVRYNNVIRPACLWSTNDDLRNLEGSEGVVVGWGKDQTGKSSTPLPNRVKTKVVSEGECLRSHASFSSLTSNRTFCAGNKGSGPCTGDSGGGWMVLHEQRWTVRGIVSVAIGDMRESCNLDEYVVYTDVSKFMGWINLYLT